MESRSRSAGHHRRSARRSLPVPAAALAGLAVLVVLGLVFGLAFLRQPSTTGEASLDLTSGPAPNGPKAAAPTDSPTTSPTAAPKKKHPPRSTAPRRSSGPARPATTKPAARKKTATHRPRPKKTTTAPATGGSGSVAAQVLTLTNAERAKAGCKALTTSAALTRAAQAHSADMAANNYFSHDSQNGKSPFDRMKAAGYDFSAAAENIAMGQQTPASVMDAWMNSAGHRANILNCTYTQIGIGYAVGNGSPYWTQDFGTPL